MVAGNVGDPRPLPIELGELLGDQADGVDGDVEVESRTLAPSVATVRTQLDQINACPWLVKRSDCGCGVNWCAHDQTTTTRAECLACLAEGANA